jgi:hypothetical protein
MVARLPIPGSDDGSWGDILNTYLSVAHNTDGTLGANTVPTSALQDNAVTAPKLAAGAPSAGQVLSYDGTDLDWTTITGSGSVPDADATTKGILKLAGDLSGTADSPTVPGLSTKVGTSRTVNGHALSADVTVSKADVGLGNADNTSDANKPVSTATQTALDGKADDNATVHNSGAETISGIKTFNASPIVPTPTTSGQAANKSYVDGVAGSGAPDATATVKGILKLTNDLGGTADLPTVPGLAGKASTATTITGTTSLTGGGDLSANRTISLVNDSSTPGNSKYYGTDSSGAKGYFTLPAGGSSLAIDDEGSPLTAAATSINFVGSGVTATNSGNDITVTIPDTPIETVNTVASSGSAVTIPNVTSATINLVTLTANCTLTFPTAAAGKSFTLVLQQDGTGGRTVTWPAGLKWPGGVAPPLTTTANAVDYISFLSPASAWHGFLTGSDVK